MIATLTEVRSWNPKFSLCFFFFPTFFKSTINRFCPFLLSVAKQQHLKSFTWSPNLYSPSERDLATSIWGQHFSTRGSLSEKFTNNLDFLSFFTTAREQKLHVSTTETVLDKDRLTSINTREFNAMTGSCGLGKNGGGGSNVLLLNWMQQVPLSLCLSLSGGCRTSFQWTNVERDKNRIMSECRPK